MSFITRRTLPAATLLIAFASAQTCYYPDGKTLSTDIPCDPSLPATSCCGPDSFCLGDGLCYGGGIITRGSCTDKTWNSPACAPFCRNEDTHTEIAITPCTSGGLSNTFVCGVNTTGCQDQAEMFSITSDTGIVLRPAQVAALIKTTFSTSSPSTLPQVTVTATPDAGYFSGGAMAGLAIGIAVPLLIAIGVLYMLLRREKRRFSKPKGHMYKLPDELSDDFAFKPPPPVAQHAALSSNPPNRASHMSAATSIGSDRPSSPRTVATLSPRATLNSPRSSRPVHSPRIRSATSQTFTRVSPAQSQTFLERYEQMKKNAQVQSKEIAEESHELNSTPGSPVTSKPQTPTDADGIRRYELSDSRVIRK